MIRAVEEAGLRRGEINGLRWPDVDLGARRDQGPQKPVRIVLPREVCTDPGTAAKIMHGEIQKALKTLRGGSGSTPPDTSRVEEEG